MSIAMLPPPSFPNDIGKPYAATIAWHGLTILVENERYSMRRQHGAPPGERWESEMPDHYGEVHGTIGADGDPIDVFVGRDESADTVYVVAIAKPDGTFDEVKCMLGYPSKEAALDALSKAYDDSLRILRVSAWTVADFVRRASKGVVRGDWRHGRGTRQPMAKSTEGWQAIPGGHHGGERRPRPGGGWEYRYPDGAGPAPIQLPESDRKYRLHGDQSVEWESPVGWRPVANVDIQHRVRAHGQPPPRVAVNPSTTPDEPPEGTYRMGHRPNSEGPRAFEATSGDIAPDDLLTHPERYTGHKEFLGDFIASVRRAQGNPNATIRLHRALPASSSTINEGDWVTPSKQYADLHAKGMDGWHVVSMDVPARDLRWAGDDLMEWGYYPDENKPMAKMPFVMLKASQVIALELLVRKHRAVVNVARLREMLLARRASQTDLEAAGQGSLFGGLVPKQVTVAAHTTSLGVHVPQHQTTVYARPNEPVAAPEAPVVATESAPDPHAAREAATLRELHGHLLEHARSIGLVGAPAREGAAHLEEANAKLAFLEAGPDFTRHMTTNRLPGGAHVGEWGYAPHNRADPHVVASDAMAKIVKRLNDNRRAEHQLTFNARASEPVAKPEAPVAPPAVTPPPRMTAFKAPTDAVATPVDSRFREVPPRERFHTDPKSMASIDSWIDDHRVFSTEMGDGMVMFNPRLLTNRHDPRPVAKQWPVVYIEDGRKKSAAYAALGDFIAPLDGSWKLHLPRAERTPARLRDVLEWKKKPSVMADMAMWAAIDPAAP